MQKMLRNAFKFDQPTQISINSQDNPHLFRTFLPPGNSVKVHAILIIYKEIRQACETEIAANSFSFSSRSNERKASAQISSNPPLNSSLPINAIWIQFTPLNLLLTLSPSFICWTGLQQLVNNNRVWKFIDRDFNSQWYAYLINIFLMSLFPYWFQLVTVTGTKNNH